MRRVREYLAWRDEFAATNFVAPTLDEVRAGMGLTARAATDVRTMANAGYTRSLDEPLGAGRQGLGDMIASPTPGPEAAAMANSEHARLAGALAGLTARERAVVVARTGWDGGDPLTAGQAATAFGVSTAAVRLVTAAAMAKLRASLTGTAVANDNQGANTAAFPATAVTLTVDLAETRAS